MDTFEAEVVGGPHCGQAVSVMADEVNGGGRVRTTLHFGDGKLGDPCLYQVISHPSEKRSWVGLHYIQESKKMSR